jgi:DNA ligase-1
MLPFANLLDRLSSTSSTLAKRHLMAQYFLHTPDPERGWALAALTNTLSFPLAKPAFVRELITSRVDPTLYSLSRDYVGDMAETASLMWPGISQDVTPPLLSEVVNILMNATRPELQEKIIHWLDTLDATGRWALLKLITGNIRIGVSARLAKVALADAFKKDPTEIERIWHSLQPPFSNLFEWLEGKTEKLPESNAAHFMPMMLAHPIEEAELEIIDLADFQIEMKWDGIRIQIVKAGEIIALYSRTGDDISHTFPDIVEAIASIPETQFVLDGELLAFKDGEVAPFNSLQQRLNRKTVSVAMLRDYPAHVRLYDILIDNSEDVRSLSLFERRQRLEVWYQRNRSTQMDISSVVKEPSKEALHSLRDKARHNPENGVEGLMLKRLSSPYIGGRSRGHWFKWKRNTLTLDCVLMYAQRGSGKRSSFYSDYTFGVWDAEKLVPVGKAYSGFTDEELTKLDRWVRSHTTNRFGPVREVSPELVLEIEFDSIHESKRHKSGVAMRFPRVHRIRWDKPAAEADTIENTKTLIT